MKGQSHLICARPILFIALDGMGIFLDKGANYNNMLFLGRGSRGKAKALFSLDAPACATLFRLHLKGALKYENDWFKKNLEVRLHLYYSRIWLFQQITPTPFLRKAIVVGNYLYSFTRFCAVAEL